MRKVILFLLIAVVGCSSSDDTTTNPIVIPTNSTNKMSVDGTNYNLNHAYLTRKQLGTSTVFKLVLTDGEIYYDADHNSTGVSASYHHSMTFNLRYQPAVDDPWIAHTYLISNFNPPAIFTTAFSEDGSTVFNEASINDNNSNLVFSVNLTTWKGQATFNYGTILGVVRGTFKGTIQKEY